MRCVHALLEVERAPAVLQDHQLRGSLDSRFSRMMAGALLSEPETPAEGAVISARAEGLDAAGARPLALEIALRKPGHAPGG